MRRTLRTSGRITRSTIAVAGVGSIVATIAVLHAGTTDGRDADTTIKAPVADKWRGSLERRFFLLRQWAPLLLSASPRQHCTAGADFSWNIAYAERELGRETELAPRSSLPLVLIRSALPKVDEKAASKWAAALEMAEQDTIAPKHFLAFLRGID